MTNTSTLAQLQLQLQNFLLDKSDAADDLTLETPRFSRQERLQIYHAAYRLRLIEVLGKDYPALQAYLGEQQFSAMAEAYIAAHPSHHPSLRWFGQKLPEFLRNHDDWRSQIEIAELAEFEWRQAMAFDAADVELVVLDELRTLAPEHWMTLKLNFHPAVQLMHFYSNAPTLWKSLIDNENVVSADLAEDTQTWLIWRDDLQVVFRPLTPAEGWALYQFAAANNFADVCEGLCEWFPAEQVPMHAAQFLQHWINSGMIAAIAVSDTSSPHSTVA